MRKGVLATALFVCAACGGGGTGGPSGSASVNGNIGGQPMTALDAVSNVFASGSSSQGLLLVTNAANTCGMLSAGQQPRNAKAILIGIGSQNGTSVSAPAAAGTYTVYTRAAIGGATGLVAVATYVATDGNCAQIAGIEASSGTVTLTKIDGNAYSGTFDITFSDASHLTGTFGAIICAALTTSVGGVCT